MRRWHCIPDYIAFRLTGASAMDLSLATRTLLLDAASGTWSRELLAHAGIPGGHSAAGGSLRHKGG